MSLVEVRIRDLAVFEEAVVPFGEGFTALTGETGAGKSVCITALRLALGGRADGDPIRSGAVAARVSAVFDHLPPSLHPRLSDIGVPPDELTTLSREITRVGRGSCRINGALVSQAVLREVGEALAEITLQGASQRLLERGRQRDLLDLAASALDLRDQVRQGVGSWRSAQASLEDVRRRQAAGTAEVDAARQTVADLSALALVPGEDDHLAAERLRLRNAAALLAASEALRRAAAGDEESSGAADLLAGALDASLALEGVDPALDTLAGEAAALVDRLRELGASARGHAGGIGLDQARLAEVEERLDMLSRVRRRHGSIEQAAEALEAARQLLAAGEDGGARLGAAEAEVAAARDRAGELAVQLSERRRQAARRLEREVESALRLLELPHARLRIALERRADPAGVEVGGALVRCGPGGIDEVEIRLSTNRGTAPAPLDQGPSGGELSRLVLALSACVTETGSPLLVLDEVDSGIGGETAARVGDLLAAAGEQRQVVAVTHRAEIASRAARHLVVRKRDNGRGSVAAIEPVDAEGRVEEIARLMSGLVTDAARARAVELRGEAIATVAAGSGHPARRPRRAIR
ncbi:MAG TPA: AAA family ATPase [Candidatus Dormibacteraeota bacterium]|nr:AAA family ATPase [Candidatus Dormibacteraeota bacterium]